MPINHPNLCWLIQIDHWNNFRWKLNENKIIAMQENSFKISFAKWASIYLTLLGHSRCTQWHHTTQRSPRISIIRRHHSEKTNPTITKKPASSRLNVKTVSPGMGIFIIKIRRSCGRLTFIMGFLILVIRHLYIETAPRKLSASRYLWNLSHSCNTICMFINAIHAIFNSNPRLIHPPGLDQLKFQDTYILSYITLWNHYL